MTTDQNQKYNFNISPPSTNKLFMVMMIVSRKLIDVIKTTASDYTT
jgi:hypothetical protein